MKLGVNYPAGPFEWLAALERGRAWWRCCRRWTRDYRGERYRASPWLQRRGARPRPSSGAMKFAEFRPGQVIEAGPFQLTRGRGRCAFARTAYDPQWFHADPEARRRAAASAG
jgi:hypothetical protein